MLRNIEEELNEYDMRLAILLTTLLLIGSSLEISAQTIDQRQHKKIKRLIQKNQYNQALGLIESLLIENEDDITLNYLAGITKLKVYQQEEALSYLMKSNPSADEKYFYFLALAYFLNEQILQAKETVKNINESVLDFGELALIKNHLVSYERQQKVISNVYVKNMGETINSDAHEYNGVMTKDQKFVVFTSRKASTDNLALDGLTYEEIYRTELGEDNEWQNPTKFEYHAAKSHHTAAVAMFDNDQKMITYHDEDLFLSELKDGIWSGPTPLSVVNGEDSAETHCYVNDAFDTIYYATDYYTEEDNLDLYMITRQGNKWSEAKPLVGLNTPYHDDSPYMAANGDFYFSSQGHNSIGGYDIFKSKFDKKEGAWEQPMNMGYQINSPSDDIYFNTFGKIAYLSSGRVDGFGNLDIYRVFLFDKVNIQGQIVDLNSNQALAGAIVSIKGAENSLAISDDKGMYSVDVPIETVFDMSVSYENELIYNEKHLAKVLFSDYNDNVIHLSVDISGKYVGHQDEPKEIAIKMVNDFTTNPIEIVPADSLDNLLTLEIYKPDDRPLFAGKEIGLDDLHLSIVHFEFNKSELCVEDKKELMKLAMHLHDHAEQKIQVIGHTDLPGSIVYNKNLGRSRAKAIKEFLIELDIPAEKIVIVSKGEREPLVTTQLKNEENRRAEFKFEKTYSIVKQELAGNRQKIY